MEEKNKNNNINELENKAPKSLKFSQQEPQRQRQSIDPSVASQSFRQSDIQSIVTCQVETMTNLEDKKKKGHNVNVKKEEDIDVGVIADIIDNNSFENDKNGGKKENVVQKHKSTFKLYFLMSTISLGAFFIGYYLAVLNMSWKHVKLIYEIDENEAVMKGILTSSLPFGAIFGCLLSGTMLKKIGERRTCIIIDIIGIIFGILFIVKHYYVALSARFILGIVMGVNEGIIPIYVKKMSPMQISGKTGSFFQVFVSIGILLAYCLGQAFPFDEEELNDFSQIYLQFVLGVPILTCLFRAIVLKFWFRHTTPHNYIILGRWQRAKEVLSDIYKDEYIQEQFEILEHEMALTLKYPDTWKQVFSEFNRPRLKLGCILMILYQFSGISTVLFYSNSIFETASGSKEAANILSLISGVVMIFFALVAAEISKYYGRRPILLWGKATVVFILLSLGIISFITKEDVENETLSGFWAILTVSFVYLYLVVFNFTTGTVTWHYNADILSGLSVGFVTAILQVFSFLIGLLFPIAKEQFGVHYCFMFFAVLLFLGVLYLIPKLQETKGLSRHQVQQMFLGKLFKLSGSQYIKVKQKSEMFIGQNITVKD